MGRAYQESFACPDLAPALPEGCSLPIPGSSYEFRHCPQYSLRTAGMGLPAEHLIDGVRHPVMPVSADVAELEAGAIRYSDLTPKRSALTQLYQAETAAAREHARKNPRKDARGG